MIVPPIILVATAALAAFEIEKDGVRIQANVRAQIYTVQITNVDCPPIMSLQIGQHNGYAFTGPDGWEVKDDGNTWRCWTTDRALSIAREQSGQLQWRVSSLGAVLGLVEARVGLASGANVIIRECWGPIAEPWGTRCVVPLTLLVLGVGHTLIGARRDRRQAEHQGACAP